MIELTLAEGKNREVRRMLAKLGHKVMSLTRVAVGPVTTRGLNIGEWRYLEPGEVALLRRVAWGEAIRPPSRERRREAAPRRPQANAPAPPSSGPRVGMGHLVGSADARGGSRRGPAPRPRFGDSAGPGGPPPRGGNQARKGPSGVPRRGAVGSFAPPPRAPRPRHPLGDNGPDEILVTPFDGGNDGPPPPRPRRPSGTPPRRAGGPPRARAALVAVARRWPGEMVPGSSDKAAPPEPIRAALTATSKVGHPRGVGRSPCRSRGESAVPRRNEPRSRINGSLRDRSPDP